MVDDFKSAQKIKVLLWHGGLGGKFLTEQYKANITEDTKKSVKQLYEARNEIIKLRDSKDKSLATFHQICK